MNIQFIERQLRCAAKEIFKNIQQQLDAKTFIRLEVDKNANAIYGYSYKEDITRMDDDSRSELAFTYLTHDSKLFTKTEKRLVSYLSMHQDLILQVLSGYDAVSISSTVINCEEVHLFKNSRQQIFKQRTE